MHLLANRVAHGTQGLLEGLAPNHCGAAIIDQVGIAQLGTLRWIPHYAGYAPQIEEQLVPEQPADR